MNIDLDQVDYAIDGDSYGIYDGVIIWVMKDGTMVNRFAGQPGQERRAAAVDTLIRNNLRQPTATK